MPLQLKAQSRQVKGKSVKKLRRSGFVPGVIYGRGLKNINVSVGAGELARVFKEAGENTLLELKLDGDPARRVLIYGVATHPLKGAIEHVDFLQVKLDEKIKAAVPLIFVGESAAVKDSGGILVKNIQELHIEALPQNLPHHLEVDVAAIKTFEDHLRAADIKLPSGVKVLDDGSEIVASVVPPRTEAELAELKAEVVENVEQVGGVVKEERPAPEKTAAPSPQSESRAQPPLSRL